MMTTAKIFIFFAVVLIVAQFLPTVTSLPFGLDYALTFFVGTVHALITLLPFLSTLWALMLAVFAIEAAIALWTWSKWFLELLSHMI